MRPVGWKPGTLGAGVSKAATVVLLSSSEAGGRAADATTGPGCLRRWVHLAAWTWCGWRSAASVRSMAGMTAPGGLAVDTGEDRCTLTMAGATTQITCNAAGGGVLRMSGTRSR